MLELRNVSAGYETGLVLRNVSLTVPKASVVALLGANGAGKTTLLRVASGQLSPVSGQVRLGGEDLTGKRSEKLARRGVCHVPEGRGIFPSLTVADNIRLQAPPGVDRRKALKQAVEAFPRLGERLEQRAGTMSGGEQQMLALARAYVCEPQVVLLDEVSMGLAPKIVDEIFVYLRQLAATGISLLVVEQYVARALELADYVYILDRGRLTYVGEPSEISEEAIAHSYLGGLAS
ncbi:ABC transporter ATP-binding protein [Sporichthya polymorpha]|uniref:ABC transporter ATP-binding protein n=1 Tax=Sporichthya polymorpha TaxID=35751 RepID=UPI000362F615|nr:ABC transporter ATP-binding protein [Sporichthya polymorpha]